MKKLSFVLSILLIAVSAWAQEEISTEIDYAGVTEVRIEGIFAAVLLKGTSGNRVQGKAYIIGDFDPEDYGIVHEKEGDRLFIKVKSFRRVNWSWRMNLEGTIDLEIPEGIEVVVDNTSGRIEATGLKSNEIRLESASGSVLATGVTAEEVRLQAGSGSVTAEEVTAKFLDVKAGSGRITLENIDSDVKGTAGSGRIELFDVKGALDLKTGSGRIAGERIDLTGSSHFRSGSGSVRISLRNNLDALSYDLQSGSGSVSVDGDRMGRKYYYKKGGIEVNAVSGSGSIRIND